MFDVPQVDDQEENKVDYQNEKKEINQETIQLMKDKCDYVRKGINSNITKRLEKVANSY